MFKVVLVRGEHRVRQGRDASFGYRDLFSSEHRDYAYLIEIEMNNKRIVIEFGIIHSGKGITVHATNSRNRTLQRSATSRKHTFTYPV